MKRTISLLAFLMLSCSLFAQTKASLKGTLVDSVGNTPLEFATIALVNAKDTSLVSYTLTVKSGGFRLTGLPVGRPTRLIISYAGYNTFRKNLDLKPGELDLGQIRLAGKTLSEVTVRGERSPIVVKKDTIEFNAEAFKTRPNATVEELLRLLPGIQVNFDGTLTANGKGTNKLLIDGKRFFGDDPRVATKNLDASMIDKIQVYDDREDDPDHKVSDADVGKIINLKMKSKIRKSTLGKFYGGGGTRDRYEAGAIVSNFRDTLQVSVIGATNNLNSTGFSYGELYSMGGFNRSGGSQAWDGTFGGRGGNGLERVISTGLNVNNNYGKILKLNLSYFYTNTQRDNQSSVFNEQTLPNTILSNSSNRNFNSTNQKHAINGLVEWIPDTLRTLRYTPRANFSPYHDVENSNYFSFNTQSPRLSDNLVNNRANSFDNAFSHNFSFYIRSKNRKRSLSVTNELSLGTSGADRFNLTNTTSYSSSVANQILDRYVNNDNVNKRVSASLNYNQQIIKQITAEIFTNTRYIVGGNKDLTYDRSNLSHQYDSLSLNLSKDQLRYSFIQNIKPQLRFDIARQVNLRIGMDLETQHLDNKFGFGYADVSKSYHYLFPSVQLTLNSISANYSEYVDQPSVDQIQPIERVYDQFNSYIGNPNLQPNRVRKVSISFNKYIHQRQFGIYSSANATIAENKMIQRTTRDAVGKTTSTYVNYKSGWSANAYVGFNKQFKKQQKWQSSTNTNISLSGNRGAFFFNADEGVQTNYYLWAEQTVNFSYTSLLNISANYGLNANMTRYTGVNYSNVNTFSHNIGTNFNVRWPAKFNLDGRYNFNYNTLNAGGFRKTANIITLSLARQIMKKDRGEIKLAVYDLLNQNLSVWRSAGLNSVNTTESMILRRYFLLTYQYRFNSFK